MTFRAFGSCPIGLYFAAKQGVAAKGGKETRPFLFAVLGLLEKVSSYLEPSLVRLVLLLRNFRDVSVSRDRVLIDGHLCVQTKTALTGHSDAVATDEAGSAYIENFALRVFNMADNEDRRGKASKYVCCGLLLHCGDGLAQLNLF